MTVMECIDNKKLTAWLRSKPRAGRYDYGQPRSCLLALYLRHCGLSEFLISPSRVLLPESEIKLPDDWNWIAREWPHTYGDALDRARLCFGRRKKETAGDDDHKEVPQTEPLPSESDRREECVCVQAEQEASAGHAGDPAVAVHDE